MSGLVKIESKKALIFCTVSLNGDCCQAVPQNTVKTCTAVSNGPLLYTSWAVGAAGFTGAGTNRGTIRMGRPWSGENDSEDGKLVAMLQFSFSINCNKCGKEVTITVADLLQSFCFATASTTP